MFQSIFVTLLVGLLGILIIMRLLGRKELSQVTPLDFVYVVILGSIVGDAIYNEEVYFYHLIFALAIWALSIWGIEKLIVTFDKLRPIIEGEPLHIIEKGKVNIKNVKKANLDTEQVRTLLRMNGIFSIQEVEHAVLETSGLISVMKKAEGDQVTKAELLKDFQANRPSYLLVEEGDINEGILKRINKNKKWLLHELKSNGIALKDVYFAEWSEQNGFYIQTYEARK